MSTISVKPEMIVSDDSESDSESDSEEEMVTPKTKQVHNYPNNINKNGDYECIPCKFVCRQPSKFTIHINTQKHQRAMHFHEKGVENEARLTKLSEVYSDYKVNKFFVCKNCSYETSRSDDFDRHMKRPDHIFITKYVTEAIKNARIELQRIADEREEKRQEAFRREEIRKEEKLKEHQRWYDNLTDEERVIYDKKEKERKEAEYDANERQRDAYMRRYHGWGHDF